MKKTKIIVFALLLVLLASPIHAFAQSSERGKMFQPEYEIEITDNRAVFSFSDLGVRERNLFSPLDATSLLFSVPPNWKLAPGGLLELHFDVVVSGADLGRIQEDALIGSNLIVRFNQVVLGVISAGATGSYVQQFQIPNDALVPSREDGRHVLSITFDAQLGCTYDLNSVVTIKPSSYFDLLYEEDSPQIDFSRLPAPFYLENSIVPDSVLVVVPDNPDPLELQAAMNVTAGFGAMIDDAYDFNLVNYQALDDVRRSQNHLIFVGLPSHFDVLSDVGFEIPVRDGQFEGVPAASSDDGILQMALSPWNPSKAIMLVSGKSLDALSKAAFAMSTGNVLAYQGSALAYVSNVQFLTSDIPVVEQFTLEDLGYPTEILDGVGTSSVDYRFHISKSQVASKESYIDLVYYHSALLGYGSSSLSVYLNGQVFATDVFTEETEQITTLRVRIPPGVLRYGENLLEIRSSMLVHPSCDEIGFIDPWLTVSNQTLLFLPASEDNLLSDIVFRDLKFFPDLFTSNSDLGNVAFILPASDPVAWGIAGQISYLFGEATRLRISNLNVYFGDAIPDAVRSNRSMIIIGAPGDIPFIDEINNQLPAPFDFNDNTASEQQLQISYRIPSGQSVGYLELLTSPFNSGESILVISGNTSAGVAIAGNVLLQRDLQDQLAGVFAVSDGSQIATGNATSLFSIVGEGVPSAEQVLRTPIPSQTAPVALASPGWLAPFLIVSLLTVAGVAIFVIRASVRKDKAKKFELAESDTSDDTQSQDHD
jgi:hypothetical protein